MSRVHDEEKGSDFDPSDLEAKGSDFDPRESTDDSCVRSFSDFMAARDSRLSKDLGGLAILEGWRDEIRDGIDEVVELAENLDKAPTKGLVEQAKDKVEDIKQNLIKNQERLRWGVITLEKYEERAEKYQRKLAEAEGELKGLKEARKAGKKHRRKFNNAETRLLSLLNDARTPQHHRMLNQMFDTDSRAEVKTKSLVGYIAKKLADRGYPDTGYSLGCTLAKVIAKPAVNLMANERASIAESERPVVPAVLELMSVFPPESLSVAVVERLNTEGGVTPGLQDSINKALNKCINKPDRFSVMDSAQRNRQVLHAANGLEAFKGCHLRLVKPQVKEWVDPQIGQMEQAMRTYLKPNLRPGRKLSGGAKTVSDALRRMSMILGDEKIAPRAKKALCAEVFRGAMLVTTWRGGKTSRLKCAIEAGLVDEVSGSYQLPSVLKEEVRELKDTLSKKGKSVDGLMAELKKEKATAMSPKDMRVISTGQREKKVQGVSRGTNRRCSL